MTEDKLAGRLAFRVEGMWWVCYYAMPHTMDGAIEMGRVAMAIVQDSDRKQTFMELMKDALGDFLEDRTGERPDFWASERAPESERSGSA